MRIPARAALLLALPVLAGCAATAGTPCGSGTSADGPRPCFGCDGTVRRDEATGAPLFLAASEALASRAPRFNADGTVARDPESGAPLYDEEHGGSVVRVLVPLPR